MYSLDNYVYLELFGVRGKGFNKKNKNGKGGPKLINKKVAYQTYQNKKKSQKEVTTGKKVKVDKPVVQGNDPTEVDKKHIPPSEGTIKKKQPLKVVESKPVNKDQKVDQGSQLPNPMPLVQNPSIQGQVQYGPERPPAVIPYAPGQEPSLSPDQMLQRAQANAQQALATTQQMGAGSGGATNLSGNPTLNNGQVGQGNPPTNPTPVEQNPNPNPNSSNTGTQGATGNSGQNGHVNDQVGNNGSNSNNNQGKDGQPTNWLSRGLNWVNNAITNAKGGGDTGFKSLGDNINDISNTWKNTEGGFLNKLTAVANTHGDNLMKQYGSAAALLGGGALLGRNILRPMAANALRGFMGMNTMPYRYYYSDNSKSPVSEYRNLMYFSNMDIDE